MNEVLGGRFRLESEIGHGGMGVVYRATDAQLSRSVAVKVLPSEFGHDSTFLERFKREVMSAAKLDHPGIVHIHDFGESDGTHYYVMQLVEGTSLRAELERRGRFSVDETVEIISQVARALDYAHEQGIVHRDIKPENMLIDRDGRPRIVDFGIARSLEGTKLTQGLIGTPAYMSPEQARGEGVDGRSDQYSLAIVAYEMLTGRTPFEGDNATPWSIVNKHITQPPPDPRERCSDLPDHLCAGLERALSKSPGERFGTCGGFAKALAGEMEASSAVTVAPQAAIDEPAARPVEPRSQRSKSPALVAILGVVIVAVALMWAHLRIPA